MESRVAPGVVAVLLGSAVVVLLFVPFVVLSFRRRGELTPWRGVGWAALLVYAFALLTYTLMPFPDGDDFVCRPPILDPVAAVRDVIDDGGSPLRNAAVQQLLFNVALFVPLGFLLRSLLRRGVAVAAGAGFAISLFIELTQLTGVWGLYRCAYRFFDVADLVTNTAGAVLGSLVALAIVPRPRAGGADPAQPRPVTRGRRLLGMTVDLLSALLLSGTLAAVPIVGAALLEHPLGPAEREVVDVIAAWTPLAVQAVAVLATGSTLGEWAVLLRGDAPRGWRPLMRPVRLLAGIGGYVALTALGLGGWAAVLAVASVAAVFLTPGARGLAQTLAGMTVVDARTPGPGGRPRVADTRDAVP